MGDVLAIGAAGWAVLAVSILLATMLQRLAGQGFGMIAAPLTVLVAPDLVPATLLLVGATVGLTSSAIDLSAIARHELPPGFAGRALGAVIAAWIAASLPDPGLFAALVAGIVYLGIALSIIGVRVPIRPVTLFSAGTIAGIMGTLTAVGAPPMALLYQHEEQRRSGAMQNLFFFWGMVVSIIALTVAGLVTLRQVIVALTLLPAALAGLLLAQPLAARVARQSIRPYALTLAGLAATVLLVKQVL